jgi:hypothetical protein
MMAANPALDGGEVGRILKSDEFSPKVVRPTGGGEGVRYRLLDCKRAMDTVWNCTPPPPISAKYIFHTNYKATPWNLFVFFALFGWVWMWFVNP